MLQLDHKYTRIVIDGVPVNVDEVIADLIVTLNNVGLKTRACCQGMDIFLSKDDVVEDPVLEDYFAYISFDIVSSGASCEINSEGAKLYWHNGADISDLVDTLNNVGLKAVKYLQGTGYSYEDDPSCIIFDLNTSMLCVELCSDCIILRWHKNTKKKV